MSSVIYRGKKLQPAPFVSINKTYFRDDGGNILGSNYNITLNGYLLPDKGSPNSSGGFWTSPGYPPDEEITADSRLGALLRKQKALMELFKDQGGLLEIQSADGSQAMTANVIFNSIDFTEDLWYNYCRYTISLSANAIAPFDGENFDYLIESASESWAIENDQTSPTLNENYMLRVSHNVSAKGRIKYDVDGDVINEAWVEAKNFCLERLGYNSSIVQASGAVNAPVDYIPYNHSRTENIDILGGSYAATETWILTKEPAIEDFTVSIQTNNADGLTTVSINGTVTGLETRDAIFYENITKTRFEAAEEYFADIQSNIFNRAQTYAGITLNPIFSSKNVGKNPFAGTISYTYDYSNRPTYIIEGALSESISVTINDKSDKFASVPVLGRPEGPVLQDLGTSDLTTKTLSIECVFGPSYNSGDIKGSFEFPDSKFATIVDLLDPINNGATYSYKNQPQKTWEPFTGRASLNITWGYEV